jgi:ABC-type uncharacterized transport system auxiliary subunit
MNTHTQLHRIYRTGGPLLAAALAALFLAGCGINKPFPEKGLFAIDAGEPSASAPATQPAGTATPTALQIPQLRVATPFDSNTFIYRIGPQKYTADYYNGFIASPASLLTAQLIHYLGRTGIYNYVVDGSSNVDHTLVLEGNVTELYGDYSHSKPPQAVIAIRFFVFQQTNDGALVLHDKLYRASHPASSDNPEALVQAWGSAYRQIIDSLTADLRTIDTSHAVRQASTQ